MGADQYGPKVPARVRRAPGQRGGRPAKGPEGVGGQRGLSSRAPPEVQAVPAKVPLLPEVGHSCHRGAQDEFGVVLGQADQHAAITEPQDGGPAGVKPGPRARESSWLIAFLGRDATSALRERSLV